MRWFGLAWGIDGRAPICDPDYHVPAPIGVRCAAGCGEEIHRRDRGVITATGGPAEIGFTFEVGSVLCVAYHVDCFIGQILPEHSTVIERRA